jgi:hypothetical protein
LKSGALEKAIGAFEEKFKTGSDLFQPGTRRADRLLRLRHEELKPCPTIAEAFFDVGCDIHLSPCMTVEDLRAGLGAAGLA